MRTLAHNRIALVLSVVLFAALSLISFGCTPPKELPEPESPRARAYVARCAVCHQAYHPSDLTAKMWESMMTLMDGQMARRGMPPLEGAERDSILQYLSDHAAQH